MLSLNIKGCKIETFFLHGRIIKSNFVLHKKKKKHINKCFVRFDIWISSDDFITKDNINYYYADGFGCHQNFLSNNSLKPSNLNVLFNDVRLPLRYIGYNYHLIKYYNVLKI